MSTTPIVDLDAMLDTIQDWIDSGDLAAVVDAVAPTTPEQLTALFERLPLKQRAVVYRLLPKERSIDVFERLSPGLQSDLIRGLQDSEVASIFADLDPDDRVWLLDELPAAVTPRLLQGLSERERQLTADVLGYPKSSVGRRMTPEYVSTRAESTVADALRRVHARLDEAETVYTLPVLDGSRHVVGIVSLRDLLRANRETVVMNIMQPAQVVTAYKDAEVAARICTGMRLLAVPVVDKEARLVGMLTIDDAVKILELEETEDAARQGGVEPLRRPYFATPIHSLVSSRIVWLLVLAIGATLTVQVLSVFEATLEQVTVLALFVPLLIGTGGNTGNQAATTVTRALALGDVQPRDLGRVLSRELGVGVALGSLLGVLGGAITAAIYEPRIGLVIGFTLLAVCSMAATIGGIMPMVARALRVDPAVFSNPFITTFVDASGLVIYFLIARTVLQI
ncbi:magnesium transporter [Aeromicrobium sp. YIM 150415]|uniref:magnesium transporter n=1 Tax=Aeromicrobium sp. YIM 150415 TaxID=2803912 RepID=UPI0019636B36|nr:magnesium transporter [Aeromicrobium sp. YIM 150415]MBM9463831.1 magnesium transporter [Aeromicrobium sp. YIM 150415]